MGVVRGTVLHCSRFGAVIRLEDGRLASLLADQPGMALIRRTSTGGRHPQFSFVVEEERGRRVRVGLADQADLAQVDDSARARASSSLEQKIIDYLRQTAEWDTRVSESARGDEPVRADRLLPFEYRARRQYRETPQRPRRPRQR
ncbi:MAG TPA: hypothetical protein VEJ20_04580 [Candidatus Eremiobacteraceae bacterium]|nr:hypothetical protein [Candidatus Eremiobacteraceae bacterium]